MSQNIKEIEATVVPFFARFLEEQEATLSNATANPFVTLKYPSDFEEY
ncbi:MAG: microviridin/marinostatin family tricyclic proteinase inhibitor [Sphaerospermopsis sp. SIO1G1]|nr:microviridin/marinostatin family tricyclic proteinase inhibitor [Sphaerospermopsis sp. SIO1G1]